MRGAKEARISYVQRHAAENSTGYRTYSLLGHREGRTYVFMLCEDTCT